MSRNTPVWILGPKLQRGTHIPEAPASVVSATTQRCAMTPCETGASRIGVPKLELGNKVRVRCEFSVSRNAVVLLMTFGLFIAQAAPSQAQETASPADGAARDRDFFEKNIRPVLVRHCYECHSTKSKKIQGGLVLDSREGIRKGGDTGPGVAPGKPDESEVLAAMRYETFEMPPKGKLPANVLADFETWIERGAFDPREGAATVTTSIARADASHWSLQPVKSQTFPKFNNRIGRGQTLIASCSRGSKPRACRLRRTLIERRWCGVYLSTCMARRRPSNRSTAS